MESTEKTYICFCGKSLEKNKFSRHAQLCPVYRVKKEELQPEVIKLQSKGMSYKQIAATLTATASLSIPGLIIPVSFVRRCLPKPKQKETKATPAAKTTEQKLTLKEFLKKLDDPTFWDKLLNSGLLDEQIKVFVGHLLDQIISLQKQIKDRQETILSLQGKNRILESDKAELCQKNKVLSRGTEVLTSQLNAQKREENAELIEKCRKAIATSGEGSMARS